MSSLSEIHPGPCTRPPPALYCKVLVILAGLGAPAAAGYAGNQEDIRPRRPTVPHAQLFPPEAMHLAIRDLSKTYRNGTRALSRVSLDVPQGMFGLLGRNGAGKSTLMRILATLQEPDEGTVRLGEVDVLRQKDEVRKTLGYLPQSFGFHPKAKAERLLEHFAILKGIAEAGVRRDVVHSLLRQTNLWEVRAERLGTFSGGMRQRFGVAVALLGNPKLIIVDEPTAG